MRRRARTVGAIVNGGPPRRSAASTSNSPCGGRTAGTRRRWPAGVMREPAESSEQRHRIELVGEVRSLSRPLVHELVHLIARCHGAFAVGDLDGVKANLAADVVLHIPGHQPLSGEHNGPDGFVRFLLASRAATDDTLSTAPPRSMRWGSRARVRRTGDE